MSMGVTTRLSVLIVTWACVIGGVDGKSVIASPQTSEFATAGTEVPHVATVLRDGSRLLGLQLETDSVPLESKSLGSLRIPFTEIESFEMRDRETATVRLRDGGIVNGSVASRELVLEMSIGRIKVPFAEIREGSVCPAVVAKGDVALASRGAEVAGVFDGGSGPCLIDGNTTDYDAAKGFARAVGLYPEWTITFPHVYLLSEIRVLLWDRDNRFQRFIVETSIDGVDYRVAGDRSQGEPRSWQMFSFTPRPAKHVRIRGIYYSRVPQTGGLDVVELEAYCPSADHRGKRGPK